MTLNCAKSPVMYCTSHAQHIHVVTQMYSGEQLDGSSCGSVRATTGDSR